MEKVEILSLAVVGLIILILFLLLALAHMHNEFSEYKYNDRNTTKKHFDLIEEIQDLKNSIKKLQDSNTELTLRNSKLAEENKSLIKQLDDVTKKEDPSYSKEDLLAFAELEDLRRENKELRMLRFKFYHDIICALSKSNGFSGMADSIEKGRLANAFDEDIASLSIESLEITAKINSHKNKTDSTATYDVNLNDWTCSCDDFTFKRTHTCKHLFYTAYSIGLLQNYRARGKDIVQTLIDQTKKEKHNPKIKI